MATGLIVVERCDALLAAWDGEPAGGFGGTADVVAYARSRGRPVSRQFAHVVACRDGRLELFVLEGEDLNDPGELFGLVPRPGAPFDEIGDAGVQFSVLVDERLLCRGQPVLRSNACPELVLQVGVLVSEEPTLAADLCGERCHRELAVGTDGLPLEETFHGITNDPAFVDSRGGRRLAHRDLVWGQPSWPSRRRDSR